MITYTTKHCDPGDVIERVAEDCYQKVYDRGLRLPMPGVSDEDVRRWEASGIWERVTDAHPPS